MSTHLAEDHEHKVKVSILGREKNGLRRGIKEAIQIRKLKPSLNKNEQDRYYLPHIFDNLIEKTKKLEQTAHRENQTARPLQDQDVEKF